MSEDAISLVFLFFGVVLLPAVGVPVTRMAAAADLARNGAAGICTRHTQASDEAWMAGHRAALPRVRTTVPVAAATVVAAVGAGVVGGDGWATAVGLAGLVVETIVLASSVRPANAAARQATTR